MTRMQARDSIERDIADRLAVDLPDVDLLEVVVAGRADSAMLRIVIDHPNGVDHGLCVDVTKSLDRAGLRENFGIEVSSPGPEPPLRTTAHFTRALGSKIRVRVETNSGALRARTGTLLAVDDETLSLATTKGVETLQRTLVRRAHLLEESGAEGAIHVEDNVTGGPA
jgi:ribosome maturation factor RimP